MKEEALKSLLEPDVIVDTRTESIRRVRTAFVGATGKAVVECRKETIGTFIDRGVDGLHRGEVRAILDAWSVEICEAVDRLRAGEER